MSMKREAMVDWRGDRKPGKESLTTESGLPRQNPTLPLRARSWSGVLQGAPCSTARPWSPIRSWAPAWDDSFTTVFGASYIGHEFFAMYSIRTHSDK